jgi:ribosomal protein L34E
MSKTVNPVYLFAFEKLFHFMKKNSTSAICDHCGIKFYSVIFLESIKKARKTLRITKKTNAPLCSCVPTTTTASSVPHSLSNKTR